MQFPWDVFIWSSLMSKYQLASAKTAATGVPTIISLKRGICLQHEAAKVRFIWRFIHNLVHPASLLGQVAVKSWNPQRVKTDWKFLLVEFGKMVEQDSEVVSNPTSYHLWLILLRYECLDRRGRKQEDVEKFWWHKGDCLHISLLFFWRISSACAS